ncbi:MAG: sulfur carrier protein ThiS [Planctomycetota bacterium]|jgi:thiamine biosynthesis protein ThiS
MEILKINGKEKEFPAGIPVTLTDLLEKLSINSATVVAEIDGRIIKKDNFSKTALSTDQNIELIRFVSGG